jgi:hypothetical protein
MKKKAALAAALICTLIILPFTEQVGANPNPGPAPPDINVSYSYDWLGNLVLKFHSSTWMDTNTSKREAWYSLDGQNKVSIPLTFKGWTYWDHYCFSEVEGEASIPIWSHGWSFGPHILNVTAVYDYGSYALTNNRTFYIGQPEPTPTPAALSFISPQNQTTYNSGNVSLVFTVNSKVLYAYYTLDKTEDSSTKGWNRFDGNITLTGLSAGQHKIEVFAQTENTTPGYVEETVVFNVDPNSPQPSVPEFTGGAFLAVLLLTLTLAAFVRLTRKRCLQT